MSAAESYSYSYTDNPPRHSPARSNHPRTGYYLSEHSQYQLAGLQQHLQFLARAVSSRNADDEHDVTLQCTPDQLAWCFRLLAGQIAPVLAELEGPGPITLGTEETTTALAE
jgi:hypothetical protein